MNITTFAGAPKVQFNLEGYVMHASPSLEVIHLCLQPGESIPLHPNPFDVVACALAGEVILYTGNEQHKLGLYDVAEIAKDTNRGFTNISSNEARLLILKKL